jgi:SAM-dependent methyltransferase
MGSSSVTSSIRDSWSSGAAYEGYVGRWSRLVAPIFLDWLAVPARRRWLDVGCGTALLTRAILERFDPVSVVGVDPSPGFLEHARSAVTDPRVQLAQGTAAETGVADGSVDAVVSGLVLNFVPDVAAALAEAARVVTPDGTVGSYVWDYAEGMEFMRRFWEAVIAQDPTTSARDEATRFPIAAPGPLGDAYRAAGFEDVEVRAIEIPTHFADFDDFWTPFLRGTGPGPAYVAALGEDIRTDLRERLRTALPTEPDGSIRLTARAWAARGRRPGA